MAYRNVIDLDHSSRLQRGEKIGKDVVIYGSKDMSRPENEHDPVILYYAIIPLQVAIAGGPLGALPSSRPCHTDTRGAS